MWIVLYEPFLITIIQRKAQKIKRAYKVIILQRTVQARRGGQAERPLGPWSVSLACPWQDEFNPWEAAEAGPLITTMAAAVMNCNV